VWRNGVESQARLFLEAEDGVLYRIGENNGSGTQDRAAAAWLKQKLMEVNDELMKLRNLMKWRDISPGNFTRSIFEASCHFSP
jgi:hypothetical protein